jgi:hypothetical protein
MNPTGQVFNPAKSFPVGGSTGSAAFFIVATDSIGATQSPGEIAAWDGGPRFVVEASPAGGPGGVTRRAPSSRGWPSPPRRRRALSCSPRTWPTDSGGYPLTIHGLWGLRVGNSAFGGSSSLVFSAGPSAYNDGSVGIINPAG